MKKNFNTIIIITSIIIIGIISFFAYKKHLIIENITETACKTLKCEDLVVNKKNQDFIYTNNEFHEMEKWKREGKSFETLITDALAGNRAALYTIGFGYLSGYPKEIFTPSLKSSYVYFSKSASLGFAPSVHNLYRIYINNLKNAFLATVYIKLCILLGHTEFSQNYIKHNKSLQSTCIEMFNEIERIALHKYKTIIKNKNKKFDAITNIIDEDSNYGNQYWENFYKKCKKK